MPSRPSRRQALSLMAAVMAAPTAGRADSAALASLDGSYAGSFEGEASGELTFTVTNRQLIGTLQGQIRNDPIEGTFAGAVAEDGTIALPLTGSVRDTSRFDLGSFPFTGSVTGRIGGASCSGDWAGANQFARHAGTWSAARK